MAMEALNVYNNSPFTHERPFLGLPGVLGCDVAYLRPKVPEQRVVRLGRAAGDVADVIRIDGARSQVLEAQLDQGPETIVSAETVSPLVEQLYRVQPEIVDADLPMGEGVFTPHPVAEPLFKPEIVAPIPAEEIARRAHGTFGPATLADIPRMVEADMKGFGDVYANYKQTEDEMRAELTEKFTGRFNIVGGDWIQVYEGPDRTGFMLSCPTDKKPQDFVSWEETTDNGTLRSTYKPEGKNIYIVSLTMEGCGEAARNMIFVNQIGKMIAEGYENFFFETRLPGLRAWVEDECKELGLDINALTDESKLAFANRYFRSTKINSKGKEVPRDPLVRIYSGVGCTFDKIVPNAYADEPSMNFGAVGVLKNPLPKILQGKSPVKRLIQRTIGGGMRKLSHMSAFSKVAERLF